MKRSTTSDDVFVHAPPPSAFHMILGLPRDDGWWPRARFGIHGDRISARIPAFGRGRRAVRFVARTTKVRTGEGLVWLLERGELRGTGAWWFERVRDGTVVHYLLDVEPGNRGRLRRFTSRVARHRKAIRRGMNMMKDRLDAAAGAARV